jgi:hypothetical protein
MARRTAAPLGVKPQSASQKSVERFFEKKHDKTKDGLSSIQSKSDRPKPENYKNDETDTGRMVRRSGRALQFDSSRGMWGQRQPDDIRRPDRWLRRQNAQNRALWHERGPLGGKVCRGALASLCLACPCRRGRVTAALTADRVQFGDAAQPGPEQPSAPRGAQAST